jgi:ubiquinone biosynthesis protein COQ9
MTETSPKKKKAAPKAEKAKTGTALKDVVLKAALKDAAIDGFTDSLLAKAGKSAGADKAALAEMFPDGALSLVEYFSSAVDAAMEEKLKAVDLS